jgi:hypothetical protein
MLMEACRYYDVEGVAQIACRRPPGHEQDVTPLPVTTPETGVDVSTAAN